MDKVITELAFVIKLSKGDAVPLARESGRRSVVSM
jgi:hypothetical protein